MSQPSLVCSVIWLPAVPWLTLSTTSISPFAGQCVGSVSHTDDHVPHPYGVCAMSKTKRPELCCFLDDTRADLRAVDAAASVVSTLSTADENVAEVKFSALEPGRST